MRNLFKILILSLLGAQLSACFGVKMRNNGEELIPAPSTIVGPHLASVSVTNGNPTNSTTYGLSYGAITNVYTEYCILENDTDVSSCTFTAGTLPASFVVSATENTKKLSVWLKDAEGLVSPRVDTGSVLLDTTAPALASVAITNSNPTNALAYSLLYGATTGTYSRYCILENDTDVSNCSFVAGALPGTFTVSTTENAKTLSVWLRDSAGNTSGRVDTGAVTLDITPPSLASVTLTSNALTFSTYDLVYGAVTNGPYGEYCVLENNTDVSDCTFITGTLPSSRKLSESAGGKTLSVWLKDSLGNVSSRVASNTVTVSPVADLVWSRGSSTAFGLGVVSVGRKSVPVDFRLQNYGSAAATSCGAPTLSNSTDFEIVSEDCGTSAVLARRECTVQLRATPQSTGSKATTLSRTCNGTTTTATITGYGVSGSPTQISVGKNMSCAVLSSGTVFCWGQSDYLGNGGANGQWSDFAAGITTATEVAVTETGVGFETACAVLADQTVQCWGDNHMGTLGAGLGAVESLTPVAVSGLSGVIQLAAGYQFFCALLSDGTVKCWGNNSSEIIGDGSYNSRWTPDLVVNLTGAVRIASSSMNVCAVLSGGQLKCWGKGSGLTYATPTLVPGITTAVDVAVADGTVCALLSDQSVQCFGSNLAGQVGNGTTTPEPTPVTVLSSAASLDASQKSVCARMTNGTLKCWGSNPYGQLGDGTTFDRLVPTDVTNLPSTVSQVSIGTRHGCALHTDSTISCWGAPAKALGDDLDVTITHPTAVLSGATQISVGGQANCARMTDGTVKCWGLGGGSSPETRGDALGTGIPTGATTTAVTVSGITTAVQVDAGDEFACALLSDGTVTCWGANWAGALGDGTDTDRPTPVMVSGLTGATAIGAGGGSACALLADQTVKCWGYNGDGNLGDGSTNDSFTPVSVSGLSGVTQISLGPWHACALLVDGTVKCWGENISGELGDGTTNDSPVPVAVAGLPKATRIAAGYEGSCAILADETVRCWGYDDSGTFLDGQDHLIFPAPPVDAHVSGITQIAVGTSSSCAAGTDGTVVCAGYDTASSPRVTGDDFAIRPAFGLTNITSVSLSRTASSTGCALDATGVVYCWGPNETWNTGVVNIAPRLVSGLIP